MCVYVCMLIHTEREREIDGMKLVVPSSVFAVRSLGPGLSTSVDKPTPYSHTQIWFFSDPTLGNS